MSKYTVYEKDNRTNQMHKVYNTDDYDLAIELQNNDKYDLTVIRFIVQNF